MRGCKRGWVRIAVKQMMTPTTTPREWPGVQQSTCWADGLEWQGWRAHVRGERGCRGGWITEERRQQRKYFAGCREENVLPPVKAFPKKELSLFTLLAPRLDPCTWSQGSQREHFETLKPESACTLHCTAQHFQDTRWQDISARRNITERH